MSGTNPNARKEVNDALISSGSAAVGQMVDTANSSIEKRRMNKAERERRDAEEKAAREKADAAVRSQPSRKLKPPNLLCADDINDRRAAVPARRLYTVAHTTFIPLCRYCLHVSDFSLEDEGGPCSAGEGGGLSFGDPTSRAPFGLTEFDLCWYFQEAVLIKCFSRGSATHFVHLDCSIQIGVGWNRLSG